MQLQHESLDRVEYPDKIKNAKGGEVNGVRCCTLAGHVAISTLLCVY